VLTCDAVFTGINRIKYYGDPSGIIGNKLNDAVNEFYKRNNDLPTKIKIMRTALESVRNITDEECKSTFFITYRLIPLKGNANRNYLKDWIEGQYNDIFSMLSKENYVGAVSYSLYTLYIILADFNIDDSSRRAIEYTLRKAEGKPFAEAAPILVKVLEFFYLNNKEEFDTDSSYLNQSSDSGESITGIINQYKSMLGNFMKAFNK
jgi:hypothetical protein